ncbi:MAG TPA: alpha-L-fucosidase [Capsulimonadaceae bacterium]|jgi:alpha-L-fucosidase
MMNKRRMTGILLAVGLLSCSLSLAPSIAAAQSVDPHATESKAERDARMGWWRDARFGMFIHWGLYAVPGGVWGNKNGYGEWIMNSAKIPVAEYAALSAKFNPTQFNADTWVSVAKAAGMKYIVMTAKHHDGFAMYRTAVDGYNIYDATPLKRDPISEMTAASKKAGVKFGVYYSQAQDWHHAGGAAYGGHWDKAQDGDLHEYVRTVAAPQVAELLTKYNPDVLWWDTPVGMSPDDIKSLTAGFAAHPKLIANNRLGNGVKCDTETPEQYIPPKGFPGKDWETCMTINDHWGYCASDTHFKSPVTLIHNLVDVASKGGNYLLNVGPDATGTIPQPEIDALLAVGAWLKLNGESIYGTTASPLDRLPKNVRITTRGTKLYLHVFDWKDGVTLPGLVTEVDSATTLVGNVKLGVTKSVDGVTSIAAPSTPDAADTVVVLKLKGPIEVKPVSLAIRPSADGSFGLTADAAELVGAMQLEGSPSNIGYWTNVHDTASWEVVTPATGGNYTVSLEYACDRGSGGSKFEIVASTTRVSGVVEDTGSWGVYKTVTMPGTVSLPGGTSKVSIEARTMPHGAVMNLRRVVLTPAK